MANLDAYLIDTERIQNAISASGDVAMFESAVEAPINPLIVHIDPVQEGEGDPSPENIRPFAGLTEMTIRARNKNLCNTLYSESSAYGLGWERYDDGSVHVYGTSTNSSAGVTKVSAIFWLPAGTYTTSGFGSNSTSPFLRVRGYNASGSPTIILRSGNGTFSIDETMQVDIGLYVSGRTTTDRMFYPMIRLASESDTEYVKSKFRNETVSWQTQAGTVYAGEIDLSSGKLTAYPYYASYNGESLPGRWASDRDVYEEGTSPTIGAQVVDLSGSGTDYSITPTSFLSLIGKNNIWADTGPVEVNIAAIDGKLRFKLIDA